MGLVSGLHGHFALWLPPGLACAVLVAWVGLRWGRQAATLGLAMLGLSVGGAAIGALELRRDSFDCRGVWRSGDRVSLRGLALDYLPARHRGMVRLRARRASRSCRWTGPVRLLTDGPILPGARYELEGVWQLRRTPGLGPRSPERSGWIVVEKLATPEAGEATPATPHPFLSVRGALASRLWEVYPQRWAPFALALVLGQRETIDPEVSRRLARSGLAHLLAISGLHVGLLALGLVALGRMFGLAERRAHVLGVALTWAYVFLIGVPASAFRAALMILFWTLGKLAGRPSSPFDVLGLAALVLLVIRPWSVVEAGFQLSFAGAAAVAYASQEARSLRWIGNRPPWVRVAALSLITSAAAVLLTAPVTASHFGRVTPAAIVGNLLAVPLLGLAMPALFSSALLSGWPDLAAWPAAAALVLLRAIDAVAAGLSAIEWLSLSFERPGLVFSLTYLVLLILGAHALHGAWQRQRFVRAAGVAAAIALLWMPVRAQLPAELSIYLIDVGQGDAIAIETPGHHWILVDAGPRGDRFDAGLSRVVPLLKRRGARRLEAWVLTHPDMDHVGGAPAVLDALEVERVIGPGRVTGQAGQIAVLEKLASDSIEWIRASDESRLTLDGVELVFLHPGDLGRVAELDEPNALSLVFRLEYGRFAMLFTGDVPGSVEDELSRTDGASVRAQILKVSHHGSASSTSERFLDAVQPELAVISVGRGNRYGHPAERVLRRLAARGVAVRRTDREGTLVIEARPDGTWRVRSTAEGL